MRYTKGEEWPLRVENFDEVKDKIEKGMPFRIANEDWIYKVEEYSSLPNGVYCLRRMHKQSKHSLFKHFFTFIKVEEPERKILVGKEHEDLILKEVEAWAREVNEKGKAFSGCDFMAYMRAIPLSILSTGDFLEKVVDALDKGFEEKMKHVRGKEMVEKFDKMHEDAVALLCGRVEEDPKTIHNKPKQVTFFDFIDKKK